MKIKCTYCNQEGGANAYCGHCGHALPESAGWVEYYYKHFFRGVEMARGIKITAKTEEEAFERAKADFLKPYYRSGQRGRLDAYHRFELISVTPNVTDEVEENEM